MVQQEGRSCWCRTWSTVTLLFATKIHQDSEPRRNQRKLWEIWRQQCLLKTHEGKKVSVRFEIFVCLTQRLSLSHSIYITAFIFRLQLLEVNHESRHTHAFTSMCTLWQYIKDTCVYIILSIDSSYTIVGCRRWWWSLQLRPTYQLEQRQAAVQNSHMSLGIDGCISHCPGQDWAFKIRLRSLKKSKYMKHRI